jgi:hypothetical protein
MMNDTTTPTQVALEMSLSTPKNTIEHITMNHTRARRRTFLYWGCPRLRTTDISTTQIHSKILDEVRWQTHFEINTASLHSVTIPLFNTATPLNHWSSLQGCTTRTAGMTWEQERQGQKTHPQPMRQAI